MWPHFLTGNPPQVAQSLPALSFIPRRINPPTSIPWVNTEFFWDVPVFLLPEKTDLCHPHASTQIDIFSQSSFHHERASADNSLPPDLP
jgi:hypothetical protein